MTTTPPPEKKCEFCDKRGLPLLLVRNAVAPAAEGAPLAASLPIELAASAAHYTTRLLRTGYVNVHDEARKRWETYFVTGEGFFFKLLDTTGVTQVLPGKFNCSSEAHRAIASCITVPDPKNATKVWIGFSDVLWTDAVRKANEDPAYRRRHMVEIDVKAALAGGKVPHARPIAQVPAVVAEYAMSVGKGMKVFDWNPFKFDPRLGRVEIFMRECEALRPGKGLIVTLPDPAGIAQELALLMKRNADLFTNQPGFQRNLAASSAIGQIEQAVRIQAEHSEIAASEKMASEQVAIDPLGHVFSAETRKRTEDMRAVSIAQAKHAADVEWKRYTKKFDNRAREAWQTDFNKKLAAYDAKFIGPLALNHVAWMKSTALADYFECNYDRSHEESGAVYTAVLTQCVFATQDKLACAKLYDEWLGGSMADTKNLLLQAMVFNQKSIADAIAKAVTVNNDPRQIPWDNLFAIYGIALKRLTVAAHDSVARLVAWVAGSVASFFGRVLDSKYGVRGALMALGLISGHPIVLCTITGGKKQFRALLIRQLLLSSGLTIGEHEMKVAVGREMRRQGIHGVVMEGNTNKSWLAMANKQIDVSGMPTGLSEQQQATWLAKNILSVEALDRLNLERWRKVISQSVRFGVVAGILQGACLTKLIADEEKSLANENKDARLRLYAGVTALSASISEAIGNALKARAAMGGLRFGAGVTATAGRILAFVGAHVGLVAGLAVVLLDGVKAWDAHREKQPGLMILYASSAIVGFGVIAAIFQFVALGAAAIPIIGILILLLIGIGVLIEYLKDNPIQDWLERCPWGKLPEERYSDFATEQAQLAQALKD